MSSSFKYASDNLRDLFYKNNKDRAYNVPFEKTNVIVDGDTVMLLAMSKSLEDRVIESKMFYPSIRVNPEKCTVWDFCMSC